MIIENHLRELQESLVALDADSVRRVSHALVMVLAGGGRLLVAGNGGSAAHAQHLSAELVGRYRDDTRMPYSAIALHAETSSVTAIANDFGWNDVYARPIRAHGRQGDAFLAISTSGRSTNLLRAADAARSCGMHVWALTGARPNPLEMRADDAICAPGATTAAVQEVHQVVVHLLCEFVDACLGRVHV
jgi:D-sedoheptulose 7-phosphate isomerase